MKKKRAKKVARVTRRKKVIKNLGGRPVTVRGEKSITFRVPLKQFRGMRAAARRDGITLSEVTRRLLAKILK